MSVISVHSLLYVVELWVSVSKCQLLNVGLRILLKRRLMEQMRGHLIRWSNGDNITWYVLSWRMSQWTTRLSGNQSLPSVGSRFNVTLFSITCPPKSILHSSESQWLQSNQMFMRKPLRRFPHNWTYYSVGLGIGYVCCIKNFKTWMKYNLLVLKNHVRLKSVKTQPRIIVAYIESNPVQACNTCRRKKVKCDGKRPFRSPCIIFRLLSGFENIGASSRRTSRLIKFDPLFILLFTWHLIYPERRLRPSHDFVRHGWRN